DEPQRRFLPSKLVVHFFGSHDQRDVLSFPTRRSSDLGLKPKRRDGFWVGGAAAGMEDGWGGGACSAFFKALSSASALWGLEVFTLKPTLCIQGGHATCTCTGDGLAVDGVLYVASG